MKHLPKVFDTAKEILQWDPRSADPLTVSNVPLSRRVGAQDVRMLVGFDNGPWTYWPEFDASPQGGHRGNVYNFQYWQYVDAIYYYVHRLAAVPPVMWIDAAHRNGVKVYAAVTCDCDGCPDQFNELLQQPQAAAQQLYLIAKTYGFDGWMFDVEDGGSADQNLVEALQSLKAKSVGASYYHAFEFDVNDGNYSLFQAGTFLQSDYTESAGYPQQTYEFLKKNGAESERFRAYWAVYVYSYRCGPEVPNALYNGYDYLDVERCFKQLGQARQPDRPAQYYQSLGIYAPDWTMYGGHDFTSDALPARETFHETDRKFWVGDNPSVTSDGLLQTAQPAVSNYIRPRSSIVALPFVTRFNTGEGSFFSISGQRLASAEWCHLGCQDRLPTWCCSAGGAPGTVQANISYEDAYDGGSALTFRGTLPAKQQVEFPLFLTQAELRQTAQVLMVYKLAQNSLPPYLTLTFSDGKSYTISGQKGDGWVRATGQPATTKLMAQISLGFSNLGGTDAPVDVALGEVAVRASSSFPPPGLITPVQSGDMLTWAAPANDGIWYYNVFCRRGRSVALVGRVFLPAYDLSAALFPQPSGGTYIVQPITISGEASMLPPE